MGIRRSLLILFGTVTLMSQTLLLQADSAVKPKVEPTKPSNDASELNFKPSYLSIKGHRKLTVKDWTDPEICAQCHPRQL